MIRCNLRLQCHSLSSRSHTRMHTVTLLLLTSNHHYHHPLPPESTRTCCRHFHWHHGAYCLEHPGGRLEDCLAIRRTARDEGKDFTGISQQWETLPRGVIGNLSVLFWNYSAVFIFGEPYTSEKSQNPRREKENFCVEIAFPTWRSVLKL